MIQMVGKNNSFSSQQHNQNLLMPRKIRGAFFFEKNSLHYQFLKYGSLQYTSLFCHEFSQIPRTRLMKVNFYERILTSQNLRKSTKCYNLNFREISQNLNVKDSWNSWQLSKSVGQRKIGIKTKYPISNKNCPSFLTSQSC